MLDADGFFAQLSERQPVAPVLLARLLEFNQWPSRLLHPARAQLIWTEQELTQLDRSPSLDRVLHIHGSRRLLAQLGPYGQAVTELHEPALPLALLTPDLRQALVRRVGLMALGKTLRTLIARAQVLQARSAIGQEGMDWAMDHALDWPDSGTSHLPQQGWLADADLLGSAILARSWQGAPAPLRLRADWCLAPQACELALPETINDAQARTICLSQLAEMEPLWLSYFPPRTI